MAGGIVRMTQSGMGCPDWPRCFGLWIPPVNASQLPADFESYLSKQDIDHSFNVYHTWIEYINRLLGALLGLFILIYTVYVGFFYRKFKKGFFTVALLLLLAVILEGLLGAIVVYQNLQVSTVTIHLLGAIIIAILPLINIAKTKNKILSASKTSNIALFLFAIIILIQFYLGTQVRENVDTVSKVLLYEQRELWISQLDVRFIIHRSFSWLVIVAYLFLMYSIKELKEIKKLGTYLGFLLGVNLVLGISMVYLDMPVIAQPLHLIFGSLLLILIVYIILRLRVGLETPIISS